MVVEGPRSSPALEAAQILQFQIIEFHEFTKVQRRFWIAVIEGGKFSGLGAQIDEGDVCLIPILKGQFAFDAAVVRGRDHAYGVALIVPGELLAHLDLRRSRKNRRLGRQRESVFILRVREPSACAVVHHDVPLVPTALIVLIKDAADHNKRLVAVLALGIDLNRRAVRREIGNLADSFQVHIGADEDALAVFTNGLDVAGPAKHDLGAAVGTVGDGLAHRGWTTRLAARRFASVTGDLLALGFVGPLETTERNGMRSKESAEKGFKVPLCAGNTAKEIEAQRAVLRKRMAGKMGLCEKAEAGDPSGAGKLMPLRFADRAELHFPNDAAE